MTGDYWAVKGTSGGTARYDNRWKAMSFIHQAFMAYVTGRYSFSWTEEQKVIDSISQMCRRNIVIRNSYNEEEDIGQWV